jgi:hypothetical protein
MALLTEDRDMTKQRRVGGKGVRSRRQPRRSPE